MLDEKMRGWMRDSFIKERRLREGEVKGNRKEERNYFMRLHVWIWI